MTNAAGGSATFHKPSDDIGVKTIADFSFGASGSAPFGAGFANLTSVSFFGTPGLTLDSIGMQTSALGLIPEALLECAAARRTTAACAGGTRTAAA